MVLLLVVYHGPPFLPTWQTEEMATSEWDVTGKPLFIAEAYEGFFCYVTYAFCMQAIGFAWLLEGGSRAQAWAALIYGGSLLLGFLPGVVHVSSRYDTTATERASTPEAIFGSVEIAWCVVGTMFGLIAASGAVHLWCGKSIQ